MKKGAKGAHKAVKKGARKAKCAPMKLCGCGSGKKWEECCGRCVVPC